MVSPDVSIIFPYESSVYSVLPSTNKTDPFFIPSPTYICGIEITFALPLKNLSFEASALSY